MTQTIELEKMGLVSLAPDEQLVADGGKVPSWARKLTIGGLVAFVVDNWKDIKDGAVSAWEDYNKNNPR
ncbi:hypothetical protein U0035_17575 [Niabella yanshanensis]|uniref:Uncharacterized protein n=1 Tax=Niabella yanshanensis TaxID=577386 RepID=A0ABZ0W4D0_9BACT|nr:hypothetical protein [Niabella yanshanensis]WQD37483.1 hypothetical protein U0035_17575 [Niabella yanshanensis]